MGFLKLFSSFFWGMINKLKLHIFGLYNVIFFKLYHLIYICIETITTIKLVNPFIILSSYFYMCGWWGPLRSSLSANFTYTITVWLTVIIILYIRFPRTFSGHNWKFVPFAQHLPVAPTPSPDNPPPPALRFCEFDLFGFCMWDHKSS